MDIPADLTAQLQGLVTTYIVPLGWKLLGALAFWVVGGWVVRLIRAGLGHNDHYWQVYFDPNRAIVEVGGEAGSATPETRHLVRNAG